MKFLTISNKILQMLKKFVWVHKVPINSEHEIKLTVMVNKTKLRFYVWNLVRINMTITLRFLKFWTLVKQCLVKVVIQFQKCVQNAHHAYSIKYFYRTTWTYHQVFSDLFIHLFIFSHLEKLESTVSSPGFN